MAFKTSKSQVELRKHLLELDTLRDEYQAKTDKVYPAADLFKILWRMLDPVTLKEVEEKKFDSEAGKTYGVLKNHINEAAGKPMPGRSSRSRGGTTTRTC